MDCAVAKHLLADDDEEGSVMDILAFHDYSSFDINPDLRAVIDSYPKITLIAWSLGVWAAAHAALPRVDSAVALNGTLCPLSERHGISPEVFSATREGWSEQNRSRFYRRMCGSGETLDHFLSMAPFRSPASQKEELGFLEESIRSQGSSRFPWRYDQVIIGQRDMVFPFQRQIAAWEGYRVSVVEGLPHFPFFHLKSFREVIRCCK
ncbi:MAG: alpha/beta fold hydrolase, partial [Chlorobiaceae bacterium]|nr:alpha/beta fold hydrolase [Chlorobiaceae bacterium]